MQHILLIGAGKSTSVLIEYLKKTVAKKQWHLTVADTNIAVVQQKLNNHPYTSAVQLNIEDTIQRNNLIQHASLVISMLPPNLHGIVAKDCVVFSKHLLTASYVNEGIHDLEDEIKAKDLLFLCEMGLDPGIDHMSAMQLITRIQQQSGTITSFKSHCGGLVAPESDNNTWRYKISWNPRNVVLAGKAGALFKENNSIQHTNYELLFKSYGKVKVDSLGTLAYYPNRNSLNYMQLYNLDNAATFIRTTLRYPEFCKGWQSIIDFKLTEEEKKYNTNHLSLASFFKQHFKNYAVEDALSNIQSNALLKNQFESLGLNDDEIYINQGFCSAADVLQFILEKKLALKEEDKDMIVMLHEIEYKAYGQQFVVKSELIVKGENNVYTAMAKTVGLPLGIAAALILEGVITARGIQIPTIPNIYEPVMKALAEEGIAFKEL
jgi:saccharopine dehydrogenase (NADP+, L-glutamate forming)